MKYRKFGKLNWDVSVLGLGTWNTSSGCWGAVDERVAHETVLKAFDGGVNLFDTAEGYGYPNGLSEERLGAALLGKRDSVYIVSKVGSYGTYKGFPPQTNNPLAIRNLAHASLHRLKMDYHDVLLCHQQNPEHPEAYLEAFELLKQEGRLRLSGVSTDSLDVIKAFNCDGQCDVVEIAYSVLNREKELELIPYCREQGIAILVRGALEKGLLSGKYDQNTVFGDIRAGWNKGSKWRPLIEKQLATVSALKEAFGSNEALISASLRYLFSRNENMTVLFGAKDADQVAMNLKAGDCSLTLEEREKVEELIEL